MREQLSQERWRKMTSQYTSFLVASHRCMFEVCEVRKLLEEMLAKDVI